MNTAAADVPSEAVPIRWLRRVFAHTHDGWVTVFAIGTDGRRTTHWAPVDELEQLSPAVNNLEPTADLWFGVATRTAHLGNRRGGDKDCLAVPALWLDIDIAHDVHNSADLPASTEEARQLLEDFPLPPTAVVDSGHGLQVWWQFAEPVEAEEAQPLLERWATTWTTHATRRDWHLDNVFDLARIMRLPGTTNRKAEPVPVTLLEADWTRTYCPDDIEQFLLEQAEAPPDEPRHAYIGPPRPGDAFNAVKTGQEVLSAAGWVMGRREPTGDEHWVRPGKQARQGTGATVYAEDGHTTIWTDAVGLPTRRPLDPFGLHTHLHHGGDWRASSEELAAQGYGERNRADDDLSWVAAGNGAEPKTPVQVTADDEAVALARLVTHERRVRLARRIVRDEEQVEAADFGAVDVVTAADLLRRERPERVQVLGNLVLEGHNATVTARFKTGKTTFVENMAAAITSGGRFLARYDVTEPLRVALLNYELDEEDQADRIGALGLDDDAMQRLSIINLRGRRLPLMTDIGADWLVRTLIDLGAQVLVVDPFGAAYAAAGGENENDNAEVRRFLLALDRVKEAAGCRTLVMPIHSGRGEQTEGEEHGRGATVLDDWPDVRILLTSVDGTRFLRSEGRRQSQHLNESRLQYDPESHGLWLGEGDVGLGRRQARAAAHIRKVADLVEERPGMNATELEAALGGAGVSFNEDKRDAIQQALLRGQIHRHPKGRAQLHYPGEIHADEHPCRGGWSD